MVLAARRNAVNESRVQSFSATDLELLADSISARAERIRSVAATMKKHGIKQMGIDGATKPERAKAIFNEFYSNATKALNLLIDID